MNNEIPEITYRRIKIRYVEDTNRWMFELRGKERSSETLKNAKDAIDKPAPKDKSDSFTQFDAVLYVYGEYRHCRVTSMAEFTYGDQYFWVVCDGKRSRVPGRRLFENTVANRNSFAAIDDLKQKIQVLQEQSDSINLSPIVWPRTP